jgi:hypothetical protein
MNLIRGTVEWPQASAQHTAHNADTQSLNEPQINYVLFLIVHPAHS